ncbi:MAG: hypothetical protein R3D29_15215 [Nitratireductor sp.]
MISCLPLFSDNAIKFRNVIVHDVPAQYDGDGVMDFPVGTALIKTFAFPSDFREPEKNLRLIGERSYCCVRKSSTQALAYVWNEDQSDAELKGFAGKRLWFSFIDKAGEPVSLNMRFRTEPVQGLSFHQW